MGVGFGVGAKVDGAWVEVDRLVDAIAGVAAQLGVTVEPAASWVKVQADSVRALQDLAEVIGEWWQASAPKGSILYVVGPRAQVEVTAAVPAVACALIRADIEMVAGPVHDAGS